MRLFGPGFYWLFVIALSCVPTTTSVRAAGTDAGAGNWRMIVLTGPTQFAVAAPASTTGLDYQAELNAIKSAQGRL
ncbi:MAG TPA: hypothetical protein VMS40_16785, partial [Vicinamibacterales bacterium]|nr:hypothetical protein [Vicinamibacterales bacterium]